MEAARGKVAEVCGAPAEGPGAPRVSCRFTHVYPDGAAPYFTVLAPAIRGGEVEQWDEIKAAASEALIEGGGTITHHHAVGRDHRPWYDRQRPAPFAAALRAAKAELDPAGMLNPGVLIDPHEVDAAARRYPFATRHLPAADSPRSSPAAAGFPATMETITSEQPTVPAEPAPAASEPVVPRRSPLRAAIKTGRPQEWIKNVFVFAGLLFSGKFDQSHAVARGARSPSSPSA